jgi:CHAD domain-containing protein
MRIGVRRLRACLSLARRGVATERVEPLRVELRWLAHALGTARDCDVFVESTLPEFREAAARGGNGGTLETALGKLENRAVRKCRLARAHAREAVGSPRFVRLVLATAALAASPELNVALHAHGGKLAKLARDVARPLLKHRHQALLSLGNDLAHAAPEARHAARLAAKKLRYAAEFFATLYPRKKARAYRKALALLQEELGLWNDAAVAERVAAELTGAKSTAAAAFAGWAAARGTTRGDALAEAWLRFTKTRTFWSRG